jgi:hypothetical protein
MGYWLTIGKAEVSYQAGGSTDTFPPMLRPEVRQADDDVEDPAAVHDDEYDGSPSAYRSISYHAWADTLDALPVFNDLMAHVAEYAQSEGLVFIPVEVYEDRLDAVAAEADAYLETAHADAEQAQAQRALWFVRWSREARDLYGDHAAFKTPGEWE